MIPNKGSKRENSVIFKMVAPNIAGMVRRKENLAATFFSTPCITPEDIVEPVEQLKAAEQPEPVSRRYLHAKIEEEIKKLGAIKEAPLKPEDEKIAEAALKQVRKNLKKKEDVRNMIVMKLTDKLNGGKVC